jgi:TolB-like protein
MSRFKRLISEIHRRSLWQVLLIYCGGALMAYQAVQALTEGLDLPQWFPWLAIVLFFVGLPLVVATAYVRERPAQPVVPVGVTEAEAERLENEAAAARHEARRRHRFLTWRNAGLSFLTALAAWGLVAAMWVLLVGRAPSEIRQRPAAAESVTPDTRDTAGAETSQYVASVAVLPFDNVGSAEDEYLADGITDQITAQLAQVQGLKVISRTSVIALSGTSLTLPQIADTLGVRHVLEGTVQRAGDEARVTVQLIEANTDAHLWADTYTRRFGNLFELQDEIARGVSSALVATVVGLRGTAEASRTDQPAAYEAYLQGKYWLHRRTREGLRRAMEAFQGALAVDSSYAPAYAGLAAASGLWVTYGYGGELDHYAAYRQAISAADKAIALDPELAEGFATRAYVLTKAWAPTQEVEQDFEVALRLLPSSADVHGWYAHLLAREHRFDQAIEEAEKAIELDPVAPGRRVGFALDALAARRYDLTIREAEGALALEPGLLLPRALQAVSHLLLGQPEECLNLDLGRHAAIRAMCLHSLGREEPATSLIDSLSTEASSPEYDQLFSDVIILADLASYYAWRGDAERTIGYLERAFAQSPSALDFRFVYSGLFDRVRNDPALQSAIRRMRADVWNRVVQQP